MAAISSYGLRPLIVRHIIRVEVLSMHGRFAACALAGACLLPAAQKTEATAMGENADVALTVRLYIDGAAVQGVVGDDLGGHYIVAQVKVEPKYGKEVN